MTTNYVKVEKISLKDQPNINEKWVQERIAEDPSILGLGDLILKDIERSQPNSGRLDLLLQDPDTYQRYEVELQLGKTDESHIIRTLEYWDIERKRYPQYEHCAVIIAEDITSRFFNVISLFNGFIPVIAIQLNAIRLEDKISLVFTTILNQLTLGLVDEDESEQELVDRAYWENKATKETVLLADKLLEILHEFDNQYELKYNKIYIGLMKNGISNNILTIRPRKKYIVLHLRSEKNESIESLIDDAGFDLIDYDIKGRRYRIRLTKDEIKNNSEVIKDLIRRIYEGNR